MKTYVAGIDGGQSSTIAVVGDETGRIVGRGWSGGADEVGVGPNSTRMRDALQGALGGAMSTANLPEKTPFAAVVAGVSGYDGKLFGEKPAFDTPRFVLMHDAPIAHAGALAGKAGVVVIAGTGSVVYATDGTFGRTTGGWGYLFGDEGSAFWLAREALSELMRREDDGDASFAREAQTACDFFAEASLRALARAVYGGAISRDRFASFAPVVLKTGRFGPIVERGVERLARLAAGAVASGAHPLFSCVGGLLGSVSYRKLVHERLAALCPQAQVVDPRYEPAVGALLLAYREAGMPAPAGFASS